MKRVTTADLEVWRRPPVCRLTSSGLLLEGNHQNKVWRGLVAVEGSVDACRPMAIKWLPRQVTLATELACSLAGQALRLRVPAGYLVLAGVDQLPGLPRRALSGGDTVVCFGSTLQWPDDSLARMLADDSAVEELTWRKVCETPQGSSGAAWDELLANSDRHYENVVFDGQDWWLIDHELALEPLNKLYRRWVQAATRQEIADHSASANALATEMLQRRPKDHGLLKQPDSLMTQRVRLQWLADQTRNWRMGHPAIDGVFDIAEVVLRSIDLRLPTLALHLNRRLSVPDATSLWNSSSPP